jgi:prophage DNA circulation protein
MALNDLLEGLFEATWRGVEFHMVDARNETGRRWVKFLFPGRDDAAWEDLGAVDGPISITGLILGDDHVLRAQALERACRAAGPGTLLHPWLGEIEVVLAQPAGFDFSQRNLRLVRFDATFERWKPATPPAPDSLAGLLNRVLEVRDAVRGFLRTVLAPVRLALGLVGAIGGFTTGLIGTTTSLIAGVRGGGSLLASLVQPFAGLATIGALGITASYGEEVADRTDAVPATISDAALPAPAPAIAPAAELPQAVVADPQEMAALLLALAAAAPPLTLAPPAPLVVAVQAQAAVAAAEAAARIPFESRQEAEAWRARVDAGLAQAAASAAFAAQDDAEAAGALWRALQAARAAWAADITARGGRLPELSAIVTPAPAPLLRIALAIAGDEPDRVIALAEDIARRNRIRLPGAVPAGRLEYLAR